MGRRRPVEGKRRTREHVIAEMGVNYIERQVLLGNHSLERIRSDYGVDLLLFTYDARGRAEPGHVPIQVKATERARRSADGDYVLFRVERSDLVRWLAEPMPLILIIYEAGSHTGWWLHVQGYFDSLPRFSLFRMGKTTTVWVPVSQALDAAAIERIRVLRDQAL
jgi:hypothetical protein